ncbi:MAG TPA: choice-of-anchor Q domain-containing protein [Rhodanobacteraceae bacterium]|nr:choice-of-anchor Q domain-containing protein [Rhodanobacteraceae bacterium]
MQAQIDCQHRDWLAGRVAPALQLPRPHPAGTAIACAIGLAAGLPQCAHANTLTVATLDDPGPTLQLSLRQAVAMSGSGDTIDFAPGLDGAITLLHGEIAITHALTITGPGPDVISVVADSKSRIFDVGNAASPTPFDVAINGLTLTGGSVSGGNGGAILSSGVNLTIDHCVIAGNSASGAGGGLAIDGQNFKILSTLVSGNSASSNGGGLAAFNPYDGIAPSSQVIEASSFVDNNSGGNGGAIALSLALIPGPGTPPIGPAAIEVTNDTIADNTATGSGGGVYANGGAGSVLTIASSTIVDNMASTGGGIDAGGTPTLVDTIIANNPVLALSGGDLAGTFTANYNLVKTPAFAMLNGSHNIIGVDPQLGALGMNGGPTPSLLPGPKSPAIDAGDPAFTPPPTFDQRGLPRVVDVAIDIGAVERQSAEDDVFRDGFEPL